LQRSIDVFITIVGSEYDQTRIGKIVPISGNGFTATENEMCRTCPVTRSCPLQPEGRQVGE